ncbi:hypothetical protein D3C81_972080 [compost metagenome]
MESSNKVVQICNLRYKDYIAVEGIHIVNLIGKCDLGMSNKLEFVATCVTSSMIKESKSLYKTLLKLNEILDVDIMIKGVTVEETYKSEVKSLLKEHIQNNYIFKVHKEQSKIHLYSMKHIKLLNTIKIDEDSTTEIYCGKLVEENDHMCGIVTTSLRTDGDVRKISILSINGLEDKDRDVYYPEALKLMSAYIKNNTKEKTETPKKE